MKIELKNINDFTRELKIDVPWETVKPEFEISLKTFSKKVKVPGFRPGKIPRERLLKQYLPSIEAQYVDDGIQKFYVLSLQEKDIVPVNQAEIKDVHFHYEEHFAFTAIFEVEPVVSIPKMKKNMLSINKTIYIPDKQDINDAIDQLRKSHARIVKVEDGALEKDFIMCDLQKVDDSGVAIIGKKFEKQLLKVGDGSFSDDQKDKLIGLKPGETARVTLPDNKERTTTSDYDLNVINVEREELPKVDKDLLKLINPDLNTVEELETDVLKKINENFSSRSKQQYERDISDALIEKINPSVAPSMVSNYLNNILEDVKKQNNGEPMDEEKVLDSYRPMAERNLKWYVIRKELIKNENLEISKQDVLDELEEIVKKTPSSEKDIRTYYRKPSNKQKIEDDLLEKKIISFLEEYAKIKEVKVETKTLREAPHEH